MAHNYGGTMGLLQRDGIQRLRSTMGYSNKKYYLLLGNGVAATAGVGDRLSINPMEFEGPISIWGSNPVYTQI